MLASRAQLSIPGAGLAYPLRVAAIGLLDTPSQILGSAMLEGGWTTYLSLLSRAGMVPHRVGVIPTLLGGLFHLLPQCPLKSRQLTGDAQGAAVCPQSFCLMLYHSLTSTGLRNPSFSSPSWDPSTCRIQLVVFPRHPSLPSPEARTSWQRDCSSLNQDL